MADTPTAIRRALQFLWDRKTRLPLVEQYELEWMIGQTELAIDADAALGADAAADARAAERERIARKLESQPWVNSAAIADAVRNDRWDI